MTMKTTRKPDPKELKIYGINACRSFFERYPDRLIRAYFTTKTKRIFRTAMKYCVEQKKAYHIRPKEEFDKICQSQHHEEVCFVVNMRPHLTLRDFLAGLKRSMPVAILAVDGISNPHNLGSLMRVCANFGMRYLLTEQPRSMENASTFRTAEGGADAVQVIACESLPKALADLKQKEFRIVSSSSHKGRCIGPFRWPKRTVLVLGAEAEGVSEKVEALADYSLRIEGTGAVESLNVTCAASILLHNWYSKSLSPRT